MDSGVAVVTCVCTERGQTIAELAVVLPFLTFAILGIIQIGLMGYGSLAARYAAFVGARAGAVAGPLARPLAAQTAVEEIVSRVPGVRLVAADLNRTVLSLHVVKASPGADVAQERMTMTVRVSVPRLLPRPWPVRVMASCAIPMEPVF